VVDVVAALVVVVVAAALVVAWAVVLVVAGVVVLGVGACFCEARSAAMATTTTTTTTTPTIRPVLEAISSGNNLFLSVLINRPLSYCIQINRFYRLLWNHSLRPIHKHQYYCEAEYGIG